VKQAWWGFHKQLNTNNLNEVALILRAVRSFDKRDQGFILDSWFHWLCLLLCLFQMCVDKYIYISASAIDRQSCGCRSGVIYHPCCFRSVSLSAHQSSRHWWTGLLDRRWKASECHAWPRFLSRLLGRSLHPYFFTTATQRPCSYTALGWIQEMPTHQTCISVNSHLPQRIEFDHMLRVPLDGIGLLLAVRLSL